jgi:hypothetical protein
MASKSLPQPLDLLMDALRAFHQWLRAAKVRGVIIGGAAIAALGRPRMTRDVDAVIFSPGIDLRNFVAAGAQFGIVPRIADVWPFARDSRILLLRHEPSGLDLDVSLGALPFEDDMIRNAVTRTFGKTRMRFARPEDLLVMKALAGRDRDWLDIEGLLSVHKKLDLKHVRQWLNSFAETLEMPEIVSEFERFAGKRMR